MPPVPTLDFDVHDLPMDVFDLTVSGLEVQTLTLGRGYDVVASCAATKCAGPSGCGCCSGCTDDPYSEPDADVDAEE
ncbi:thiomuracin/GE37468 family thiazolyl RiPP peptide [Nonomuraea sp. NPDC049714]|uniref:thiomuracin/GE37468 family thiazolyl RiPP peptide n=1 Tax=Nonomuraea sp. NPDC049714 TaxID=3364357 RepID=UPI003795E08B